MTNKFQIATGATPSSSHYVYIAVFQRKCYTAERDIVQPSPIPYLTKNSDGSRDSNEALSTSNDAKRVVTSIPLGCCDPSLLLPPNWPLPLGFFLHLKGCSLRCWGGNGHSCCVGACFSHIHVLNHLVQHFIFDLAQLLTHVP